MADATAKALALPGYQAAQGAACPNSYVYAAKENGVEFHYVEHYWFKDGHAIQLRCVRPERDAWPAAPGRPRSTRAATTIAAQLK